MTNENDVMKLAKVLEREYHNVPGIFSDKNNSFVRMARAALAHVSGASDIDDAEMREIQVRCDAVKVENMPTQFKFADLFHIAQVDVPKLLAALRSRSRISAEVLEVAQEMENDATEHRQASANIGYLGFKEAYVRVANKLETRAAKLRNAVGGGKP